MVRSYGYHCSGEVTTPRTTSGNIKGLELELDYVGEKLEITLNNMIEEGILSTPYNLGENIECTTAIEDDGSVYKELIIKASTNKRLIKTVKKLHEYLGDISDNGTGTSCHIHYNQRYLRTNGLKSIDLFKAGEYFAPLLYRISGRDFDQYYQWSRSQIGDIENINLTKRGEFVDEIGDYCSERYRIVNCKHGSHTTELRIFSNRCNFNPEIIKLYLETSDFLVEVAKYMKNKLYEEEVENLKEMGLNFFKSRSRKKYFEKYQLDDFFLNEEEIKKRMLEKKKEKILNEFRILKRNMAFQEDIFEKNMMLLRLLRRFSEQNEVPLIELYFDGEDVERVERILLQDIENQINL